MDAQAVTPTGRSVRLEPLGPRHIDGPVAPAAADPALDRWSAVAQGRSEAERYAAPAPAPRSEGTPLPFATVRVVDGEVVGSTRFFPLDRWSWPEGHARSGRTPPDACEIGHTRLTRSAVRTAANTEARLLMLAHAFEVWQVLRVSLHTGVRDERSRAAMERIGARLEGVRHAHRIASNLTVRDSVRHSIVLSAGSDVRTRPEAWLNRQPPSSPAWASGRAARGGRTTSGYPWPRHGKGGAPAPDRPARPARLR